MTTKIHAIGDGNGKPLRFKLTPGQDSDIRQAYELMEDLACDQLLADKGYDADEFVKQLETLDIKPVIPSRSNRKEPREYDQEAYKRRNYIERLFNKLKQFRRVATRYDKTALSFIGFIYLASILLWLK